MRVIRKEIKAENGDRNEDTRNTVVTKGELHGRYCDHKQFPVQRIWNDGNARFIQYFSKYPEVNTLGTHHIRSSNKHII
jgi:hypothetical protein